MAGNGGMEYGPSSRKVLEDAMADEQEMDGSEGEEQRPFSSVNPDKEALTEARLLQIGRDAFNGGTSWFDASVRTGVEDNLNLFNSRHPNGSKYYHREYDKRSKLFRPRTRASVRKLEAAFGTALFSTTDVVTAEASNKNNKRSVLAAQIKEAILRKRLTQRGSIPWFRVAMGGAQDAFTTGSVISCQEWSFRETPEGQVLEDRPTIRLVAMENLIINPSCDWQDPINSTNYLIERMPYTIADLVAKMEADAEKKSGSSWRHLQEGEIGSALRNYWDSIRNIREGHRQDRYENEHAQGDFRTVWVHRHIVRMRNGVDYVWETLGTEFLLSKEAVPIWEAWPIRGRPYAMGCAIIEAHKVYTESPAGLGKPVQEEVNELTNQTMDNIKQAVNKRKYIRRGAAIDIHAMKRNTPGSTVFMTDPRNDVVEPQVQDVTRSAFEERDRLTAEFDDVVGTQTGASVAQRRRLDETVGGQQMLSDNINPVTELTIRTVVETWVEEALAQVMDWIEVFESDERILGGIAEGLNLEVEDVIALLAEDTDVTVNVGFGATNPAKRLESLQLAVGAALSLGGPELQQQIDAKEIVVECFGAAGYKDGQRFFPGLFQDKDPQVAKLEQMVQELQDYIQMDRGKYEAQAQLEQMRSERAIQIERMRLASKDNIEKVRMEFERWKEDQRMRIAAIEYKLKGQIEEREREELYMQREALSHSIQIADMEMAMRVYSLYHAGEKPVKGEPIPHDDDVVQLPMENQKLISSLRKPGSGEIGEPMNLEGDDAAGVLARGDYGMIPGQAG